MTQAYEVVVRAFHGDSMALEDRLWKIYSSRNNLHALKVTDPMTFRQFLDALDAAPEVDASTRDKCR